MSAELIVLALDPGNQRSAIVALTGTRILFTKLEENTSVRAWLSVCPVPANSVLVIEQVAAMGMAVGESVFETVFWSGRFSELWTTRGGSFARLTRRAVKVAICHSARATDANIRARLLDLYGGADIAVGRKSKPGPLYGIKSDMWAALALGLAYEDAKGIDVGLGRERLRED